MQHLVLHIFRRKNPYLEPFYVLDKAVKYDKIENRTKDRDCRGLRKQNLEKKGFEMKPSIDALVATLCVIVFVGLLITLRIFDAKTMTGLRASVAQLEYDNDQQRTEIGRLQTALAAEMEPYWDVVEETGTFRMAHPRNESLLVVQTKEKLADGFGFFDREETSINTSVKSSVVELAEALIKIDGILEVIVGEDFLTIHKSEICPWEELLPLVRPLIVEEFGDESVKEVGAVPEIGST